MLACTGNNLDLIAYLIRNGADMYQKNKDGWNAFQIAVRFDFLFLLLLLNKIET